MMKFVIKKEIIYKNSINSPVTHNRIELCISSKRINILYFDFYKTAFLRKLILPICSQAFFINEMPLLKI